MLAFDETPQPVKGVSRDQGSDRSGAFGSGRERVSGNQQKGNGMTKRVIAIGITAAK